MAEKTRTFVSLPSTGDLYSLKKEGNWDAAAGYEKHSGETRGYFVNNGTGRPAVLDNEPGREGPLIYDIRPEITFPGGGDVLAAVKEGMFAIIHNKDDESMTILRCCDISGREPVLLLDSSLGQIELGELPEGVEPTMESLGIGKPLKDFASLADSSYLDIHDAAGNIIYSSVIECEYDRDASLAPDMNAPSIQFGIGESQNIETDEHEEDERGYAV